MKNVSAVVRALRIALMGLGHLTSEATILQELLNYSPMRLQRFMNTGRNTQERDMDHLSWEVPVNVIFVQVV